MQIQSSRFLVNEHQSSESFLFFLLRKEKERERKTRYNARSTTGARPWSRESCFLNEDRPSNTQIPLWPVSNSYSFRQQGYHWMEHVFLASVRRVILDPGALFSFPAAREHVFVLIIIRSVLMLGRRTLGATTPQASLSRRFILRVALCLGWKQIVALSNAFQTGKGKKERERDPLDTALRSPRRERNRLSDLTRCSPPSSYMPLAPRDTLFCPSSLRIVQLLLRIRLPPLLPLLYCFESSSRMKWTSFSSSTSNG